MAHIALPEGLPGILGPMFFRRDTALVLNTLAETLLRGESTLTRGERELIAASVSNGNECQFCTNSHAAFAALQLDGGRDTVDSTLADPSAAPITPKLRTLLAIAAKVRVDGRTVTDDEGSFLTLGSPLFLSDSPLVEPTRTGALGRDTDAVLRDELGMNADEIEKLHDIGAV